MTPRRPKIYHIVHIDRLPSIITDGYIWCHSEIIRRDPSGTVIGMDNIKQRRLRTPLNSHPDLMVGDCVPFYFCPRSVMLYLIYRGNHPELDYKDGQGSIIHLEADLCATVDWANTNNIRWAFTKSNAGSLYFDDYSNLNDLDELNWQAIRATDWRSPSMKESKQAEFLVEHSFPWELVHAVTVRSQNIHELVQQAIQTGSHVPKVAVNAGYYY